MLKDLRFPFEAGGHQELTVIYGNWRKSPRCLDVQLLETDKLALLGIPAVHLSKRVIVAQNGILPAAHSKRLKDHGAPRGHGLRLPKERPIPAHHFGVSDETCEADEEVRIYLEMLDGVNVLHLRDVGASFKQFSGSVPLVNDRPLGAAGQDQVRFGRNLQVLHVSVSVPRMERLMGVEAIPVPLVDGSGTSFGAICYDEEGFSINAEGLNVVRLTDSEDVNALELDEFVCGGVPLVDVRASKQLSHNDKELVVDDQRFADHCGCT